MKATNESAVQAESIDWIRSIPFILLHVACLAVFFVGWSWTAVGVAVFVYCARVFGLTAFYHRYFSHRSFKTFRWVHFLGAMLGASAVQRGPIWWAAHHRSHHKHSDGEEDVHSPVQHGFLWSHLGWFLTKENFRTNFKLVPDLTKFPELRFVDRFELLAPTLLGVSMYVLGLVLEAYAPQLGVTGWQMFVWGFLISTVAVYHATYSVNSLAHVIGSRRFPTTDQSRNNWLIAMFTFGEGWHNNHHHYQNSARQGFYWWEIDITYYGLVIMSWLGLVWDLRPVPERILREGRNSHK